MQFKCKECGQEFESRRSLHAHLKCHKMLLADYYIKHFPRKSLMTGELLPFKNFDNYFSSDFRSHQEMNEYLSNVDIDIAQKYILKKFESWSKKYESVDSPSFIELESDLWMPKVRHCIRAFGSYANCVKASGMNLSFTKKIPKDFWETDINSPKFLCDTREQYPFNFKNKIVSKIDVGDYTLLGDSYDYTYVDRKALGDFISTMSGDNYNRFRREMSRARNLGVKLFVVIEGSIEDVRNRSKKFTKRANAEYIFGNMRRIQRDYIDVCRFVFAKDREKAQEVTARILVSGKKCWECDIQYFLEQ